MATPAENMAALITSKDYELAKANYSNAYRNGAGRQAPGTVGFALWLLYDMHYKDHNHKAPTKQMAQAMAKLHGLNETSASNALLKWSAFQGLIKPRTGNYSLGPRS